MACAIAWWGDGIGEKRQVLRCGRRSRKEGGGTLPFLTAIGDHLFRHPGSSCRVRIEETNCRVLVVEDHEFGTNDCRGWISQSLFRKLNLPGHRFYQFRLAFDKTQAKGRQGDGGRCRPETRVRHHSAQILCEAGVPRQPGAFVRSLLGDRQAHVYRGPSFSASGTSRAISNSSRATRCRTRAEDSIELEIKVHALQQIERLEAAAKEGDFAELFRLLGTAEAQRSIDSDGEAPAEYTSVENTIVEAVLKADSTGYMVRHPFVNRQLQRMLAKWAFKLCTSEDSYCPGLRWRTMAT